MNALAGTAPPSALDRVRQRVVERFPADLERIRAYLHTPSVSDTGEGILETAARTAGATSPWSSRER